MKKLHSLLFYAFLTPTVSLGTSALFAAQGSSDEPDLGEQSMGQDVDPASQSSEYNEGATKSRYNTAESTDENRGAQSDEGSIESQPVEGVAASGLIGNELKTSDDESVGRISDLMINQDGKVTAVVVNIGEHLGIGEKNVAIDWKAIKISGNPEDPNLHVDLTGEDLQSTPTYEKSEN